MVEAGRLAPLLALCRLTLDTVGEGHLAIAQGTAIGRPAVDIGEEAAR